MNVIGHPEVIVRPLQGVAPFVPADGAVIAGTVTQADGNEVGYALTYDINKPIKNLPDLNTSQTAPFESNEEMQARKTIYVKRVPSGVSTNHILLTILCITNCSRY